MWPHGHVLPQEHQYIHCYVGAGTVDFTLNSVACTYQHAYACTSTSMHLLALAS